MADILGALGGSSELVATLRDPEVRALMDEPDNLKQLAALLKDVARKATSAKKAAQAAA